MPRVNRREVLGALLGAGAAWLVLPRTARASMAVGVPLSELVAKSSTVAFSTSLERTSRWEELGGARRIVTYHRVRLEELVAGEESDAEVWVRTLGGRMNDVAQIVHGEAELAVGQTCLLFVRPARDGIRVVTELAQGHYPLADDGRGTLRLRRSPRLGTLLGAQGSAVQALVGRSRADAMTHVRQVTRGQK